jgi:selenocysteine lyase/cysteine desulfurase
LLLTADNHNSVNGIREFARAAGARVTYLPLTSPGLRVPEPALAMALEDAPTGQHHLFAYPAQSNFSGVQHPLGWVQRAKQHGWDVLLDAAAFAPTNRLDLGSCQPDFVALSFYKLFGYPTGIGGLLARRTALARLRRPWFAGGTVTVASVGGDAHALAAGEAGFEDGTINFLGLPAVEMGLRYLTQLGIDVLHARVRALTAYLLDRLTALRHPSGAPLVRIYGPTTPVWRGGTVAFNVSTCDGGTVDHRGVEAAANQVRISLRSGCFCNPGAAEAALGLSAAELGALFREVEQPTADALRQRLPGRAVGAVRASLGIATTPRDIDRLVQLLRTFAGRSAGDTAPE